ncbi:MAG: hypothetical protein LZF61_04285 [Nitrosomonas sp.]|nr:MAG: hypothetical protein LZF61_04285 [Nitrosomonas sp.]
MFQPSVVINQHRQTALIAAAQGRKLLVIKLGAGKLTVTAASLEEIRRQGYAVSDYSPKLAAISYLQHGAGVSDRARVLLEKIAANDYPASLSLQ